MFQKELKYKNSDSDKQSCDVWVFYEANVEFEELRQLCGSNPDNSQINMGDISMEVANTL